MCLWKVPYSVSPLDVPTQLYGLVYQLTVHEFPGKKPCFVECHNGDKVVWSLQTAACHQVFSLYQGQEASQSYLSKELITVENGLPLL